MNFFLSSHTHECVFITIYAHDILLSLSMEKIHKMNTKSYKSNDVDKLDYCCRFCCVQKKNTQCTLIWFCYGRKTYRLRVGRWKERERRRRWLHTRVDVFCKIFTSFAHFFDILFNLNNEERHFNILSEI
jgi:hypothetical protein